MGNVSKVPIKIQVQRRAGVCVCVCTCARFSAETTPSLQFFVPDINKTSSFCFSQIFSLVLDVFYRCEDFHH